MRFPGRMLAAALVCAACGVPALAGTAAGRPGGKTLYERLAFGRTVVIATCVEQGRFAKVDVSEVLKGEAPEPQILIAYRLANLGRIDPSEGKIEFLVGARSILILSPDETEDGRVREANRFVLDGGDDGKIDIPDEGADALLQAARRMIDIQRLSDQEEQWQSHRDLLGEVNPLLVQAGFQEILKFRLGRPDMLPVLDRYLTHPRDEFRIGSLRVMAQILAAAERRGEKLDGMELVGGDLLAVLRADAAPDVRAEAVKTAALTRRSDLFEVFREAARSDPSQRVRYEAQVALRDMSKEAKP